MDVGDLPNHVKYCVSVFKPPMSNYQYTPGPRMGVTEFPNSTTLPNASNMAGIIIFLKPNKKEK